MPYVYSTLPCGVIYNGYEKVNEGEIPNVVQGVEIKGGAGIADKNFMTPNGIVTEVTADQLAFLKEHDLFKTHVKNGFITFDTKEKDVDAVVADMERKDKSAPLTPADIKADDADVKITTEGQAV